MKDIITGLILSYIFFYAIFFVSIFLKSIKFDFGNYFLVFIELAVIVIIVTYFKNNIYLDLGTLVIFSINQIVIIAIYLSLNQEKKNHFIYKTLQKKPYNNFWISNIGNISDFEKKEIELFIKLVRDKIQLNSRKNIGFFIYDDEKHIAEYKLIVFGDYIINDLDLEGICSKENIYSRGYVGEFKKNIYI